MARDVTPRDPEDASRVPEGLAMTASPHASTPRAPGPSTSPHRRARRGRATRATAAAASLVAASTLAFGVTMAIESATTPSQSSTLSAGAVSYGGTSSDVCTVRAGLGQTAPPLRPGDASTGWVGLAGSDAPCTFRVTYQGPNDAYLGLDVLIATKSGALPGNVPPATAPLPLYSGTTTGLQLQITDSANSGAMYVDGTTYTEQGVGAAPTVIASVHCPSPYNISAYTCYQVSDLLVSTSAFASGRSDTFSVNYQLPVSAGSGTENSSATVILTVHAVQAASNPIPTSPGSIACESTDRCQTGFSWS